MVRRIRKVLCFQAKACAESIGFSAFTVNAAVEEIACVKLHARLRRRDFQNTPTLRLGYADYRPERPGISVQHPVMVVTFAALDLLVVRVNALADRMRLA